MRKLRGFANSNNPSGLRVAALLACRNLGIFARIPSEKSYKLRYIWYWYFHYFVPLEHTLNKNALVLWSIVTLSLSDHFGGVATFKEFCLSQLRHTRSPGGHWTVSVLTLDGHGRGRRKIVLISWNIVLIFHVVKFTYFDLNAKSPGSH